MSFSLIAVNESHYEPGAEWSALLRVVAELTLQMEGMPDDVEIGLTLVDDEAIRELNAQYRGIDEATDVLSFPLFDVGELESLRSQPAAFPERPVLIGDIVVSAPTTIRQAAAYGHGVQRELAFLFVHGLLHLLGHDHDDEPGRHRMRAAEEAILSAAGTER